MVVYRASGGKYPATRGANPPLGKTDWTDHVAPAAPPGYLPADPDADLASERQAGRRAAIAVIAGAVLSYGYVLVVAHVYRSIFRDDFDAGRARVPSNPGGATALVTLGSLATLAVQVFVMLWLYRTSTVARRAGWPARRDPVWAFLGFIVPIVSLWFPYQLAADSFPPKDPLRRRAGWWWTWYLLNAFGGGAVLIIAAFSSTTVAVVLEIAFVVAPVMMAITARQLIAALDQRHHELVAAS